MTQLGILITLRPIPLTMKISLLKRFLLKSLHTSITSQPTETSHNTEESLSSRLCLISGERIEILIDYKEIYYYCPQDGDLLRFT